MRYCAFCWFCAANPSSTQYSYHPTSCSSSNIPGLCVKGAQLESLPEHRLSSLESLTIFLRSCRQTCLNKSSMAFFQILSTLTFTSYPTIRHIPVTDAASFVKQSTNAGDIHGSESFTVKNSDH
jgi:hypothetical protein